MSKNDDKDTMITYTIITLADTGVGKTSILNRFSNGKFESKLISTIGFGMSSKVMTLKNGTKIRLKLIDTAGQENYQALSATYMKNADCVLFVFSLDKRQSFEDIKKWMNNLKENNHTLDYNQTFSSYLVGNKSDLEPVINEDEIEELKNENNFYGYIETSTKDDIGINKAFEEIGEIHLKSMVKKNLKISY